jgi:signal transduction histidine kinase
VTELSSYVFSELREGELTLYRGSRFGGDPILLVEHDKEYSARESSLLHRAAQTYLRQLLAASRKSKFGEVIVAVRDSGNGLNPKDADRTFNPFSTTKPEDIGLGLSISRMSIEAHNCTHWATPNEDIGATIQFALPPSSGREL